MLDIGIKRVLFSRIKGLFASYLMDMLSALHMTGASPKRLTLIGGEPLFLEPRIGLTPPNWRDRHEPSEAVWCIEALTRQP